MALSGTDDEKLEQLINKTYKEQIVWFLNAQWLNIEKDAEVFWNYAHKAADLDLQKGAEGNALDEMKAHQFLEHFKETMTVREMRTSLRETGAIDANHKFRNVPLTHFLIFRWKVDWRKLVNASQGDNQAEVEEAQRKLNEVSKAMKESEQRASESAKAVIEARSAESAAHDAKEELQKALDEVQKQEDAYNAKTESLKQKSATGGIVSRNKAKNELAQHLGEDPLPLRKAKITAEAAVKKAEKTKIAAAAARERSEQAKEAAEKAVEEAREAVAEAEKYLDEVKSKPGSAAGALWWIERELFEQKKYLPQSKGGIAK